MSTAPALDDLEPRIKEASVNDQKHWPDVSAEIVERVRTSNAAARVSLEAWESYVACLVPGVEMDVAALLSVSGEWAIGGGRHHAGRYYAAPVSTDLEEALWLVRCSEVRLEITYQPGEPDDSEEEVRAEVSWGSGREYYVGEGLHRPDDDYRDSEDIQRGLDTPDEEAAGDYHQCGKSRCMADAVTRSLMAMFSPTKEELAESEANAATKSWGGFRLRGISGSNEVIVE